MNKIRSCAVLACAAIALLATGCSAQPAAAPPPTSAMATEQPLLANVTIPAPSLAGNLVDEPTEQDIQVALPADYNAGDKRYPVVYYLPGFGDSHKVFFTAKSDAMILVGINGVSRLGGGFYVNSPVSGNWQDFVTKDVVDYVDSHYRTIAEPDGRAITGHSMGGFGVLNAAMRTDVYRYAYAMSPGVFATDGMATFALDFDILKAAADDVASLDDAAAREAFLERAGSARWPSNVSFSYAAAFAPSPAKAPFYELPAQDAAGEFKHDAVWAKYEAGYGDIAAKVARHADNLAALKGFVIEYGTNDQFAFIPGGCDHLSAALTEQGIRHDLVTYEGGHQDQLEVRLSGVVLPYLEKQFGAR